MKSLALVLLAVATLAILPACSSINSNVSEVDPYAKVDISSSGSGTSYSGEVGSRIVLRDPASGATKSAPVVPAETVPATTPVVVVPPTPAASVPVVPASMVPAGTPVAPVPASLAAPAK